MTIEANEHTYVVGMWMLHGDIPIQHFITLYRQGDGPWLLQLRQRTIIDDKDFDSADEKRSCLVTFKMPMSENAARTKAEKFIIPFSEVTGFEVEFQPVYENFMEWLNRRRKQGTLPPWLHVREEKL